MKKPPILLVVVIILLAALVITSTLLRYYRNHNNTDPLSPNQSSINKTDANMSEFASGRLYYTLPNSNQVLSVFGMDFQVGDYQSKTDSAGGYQYNPKQPTIDFYVGTNKLISIVGQQRVSLNDLPQPLAENFTTFVRLLDLPIEQNTLTIPRRVYELALDFSLAPDTFREQLSQQLAQKSTQIVSAPLGINLEAPQAEADMIGQAMPFVDIFRTARPFREFSCKSVSYDKHGWPTNIPDDCGSEKARTLALQNIHPDSLPFGEYTVFYEGEGQLEYGGNAVLVQRNPEQGFDIIRLDKKKHEQTKRMIMTINKTAAAPKHLKNIRVVMSGGVCQQTPWKRVHQASDCDKQADYVDFTETLKKDRNAIIFNPDYLNFLRHFSLIRTMNFMEASPRRPNRHYIPFCEDLSEKAYLACVTQPLQWENRAKMDDATWGGSFRTSVLERHGVPLEVTVALVNQLNKDAWFNMPHNADDDYIRRYAEYVRDHLKPELKAHIEYSNEVWNTGFWGAHYVQAKGYQRGLDKPIYPFRDADYSARVRYYAIRAVEIFKIWEDVFQGTERLMRVIGSNQTSIPTSKDILEYNNAWKHTDVLAIAPYFHGCWDREVEQCANESVVDKTLSQADSVDDIFDVLNQDYNLNQKDHKKRGNPYSLPSVLNLVKRQAELAHSFNLKLYSYEGGQHLAVRWRQDVEKHGADDAKLRELFEQANRDPRMKALYLKLLQGWKKSGGDTFVLYTLPQTYHRWGSFGIKEHLNAPLQTSPKFAAALEFQKQQEK
ncbi:MAG: hypothetical protein ACWA5U_07380 [bacterium]